MHNWYYSERHIYLDDILITGPTQESHLITLQEAVSRLEKIGFMFKKVKWTFLAESFAYIGLKTDKIVLNPPESTINTKHTYTQVRLSHYGGPIKNKSHFS